ncbi:MAG TPA: hypothetical protein DGT23_35230, partial [Micromonosporaceae bacterium]|nr:hypothetical protein [Micromonosporaceae bacterium]
MRRVIGCVLSVLMVLAGVGVAFPQTPNDVDIELFYGGTWNNIDAYVYHRDGAPIVITRGRTNEGKSCDPGKLTLTVNNRDGRFSPRNPNSPLFGKIGRNTPIRVSVTYSAVTYVRFTGEVPSWPSRWDVSGKDIWVPVEAAGILRRLGQGSKPLRSPLYRFISGSSPLAWWPLESGDQRATVSTPSGLAGGSPLVASTATIGTHALSGTVGGSAVGPPGAPIAIDLSSGGQLTAAGIPTSSSTAPWRFEMGALFTTPLGTAEAAEIMQIKYAGVNTVDVIASQAVGTHLEFRGTGTHNATPSSYILDDGAWHHIRMDFTSAGGGADTAYEVALDGVVKFSGTATGLTFGNPTRLEISAGGQVDAASHAAFWSGTLPADNAGYDAFTGYDGEEADDRFDRLCTDASIPSTVTGSTGALMGPERVVSVLQALRDAEATDQGFLHERRDALGLKFRTNASRYNQAPIALDYAAKDISPPFDPEPDEQHVANDREVKRRGGSSARRELTSGPLSTQDPPAGVGRYDDSITVDAYSDDQLEHIANWRLALGTVDAERYPRVRVDLAARPALIPTIMAADSGSRITVANLPDWLPPDDADLIVEGYREAIGFFTWDFVFNCSPGGVYSSVGRWDTVASVLKTAVNSTATSWDVATTSGPLWTTDDAQDGWDWEIGGERVTVTDIAPSLITFGAVGTAAHADNASVTPGLPASLAEGNLMLCLAAIRNSGTGAPEIPAGWVRLAVFPASVAVNVRLFARIAGPSETAPTITFTGGVAGATTSAQIARLAGKWHSTSNILLGAAICLNASAQDITIPEIGRA